MMVLSGGDVHPHSAAGQNQNTLKRIKGGAGLLDCATARDLAVEMDRDAYWALTMRLSGKRERRR
jgi:hypothetical protein